MTRPREDKRCEEWRGVRQEWCLSPTVFNLYSEYLTNKDLEVFGDFKIGGQVVRTVRQAEDFVLVVVEEAVLRGMTDRLIEIGKAVEWKLIGKN